MDLSLVGRTLGDAGREPKFESALDLIQENWTPLERRRRELVANRKIRQLYRELFGVLPDNIDVA